MPRSVSYFSMPIYPEKISERFRKAISRTTPTGANCRGVAANFECGSFVRILLSIDKDAKVIGEVGIESNGCAYMLAVADLLREEFLGRSLQELRGADRESLRIGTEKALGVIPSNRFSCREACFEALESALNDFRSAQLEEFRGEKPLVCTCFGVTEERVEDLIASGSVESVEDVTRSCNAGGGCGSCRMIIEEMIEGRVTSDG